MTEPVRQPGPERAEGRKTWDPTQDKRGLECRWCGCKHFRVIYTRPTCGGRIMRRRERRHCGNKMNTVEQRL